MMVCEKYIILALDILVLIALKTKTCLVRLIVRQWILLLLAGPESGKKLGGIDFSEFTYIGRGTAGIKLRLHKIHICRYMGKELTVASAQAV